MLDLRIVNLPGQRIPFPQSKGRKRRLVATVQPKVRTQHGNNRTVIAHQFARVHHESPAVAFAKAKGNTGPDSAVAFRPASRLAESFFDSSTMNSLYVSSNKFCLSGHAI